VASAIMQSDGRILLTGAVATDDAISTEARLYRLTTSGKLDTTFGVNGIADLHLGLPQIATPRIVDSVADIRQLASGKIVLTGLSYSYKPPGFVSSVEDYVHSVFGDGSFVVARLNSNGKPDTSYASSGFARAPFETAAQLTRLIQNDPQ